MTVTPSIKTLKAADVYCVSTDLVKAQRCSEESTRSSCEGKAFIKWARSQSLVSEQHSLNFEDFLKKYCLDDNLVTFNSSPDLVSLITRCQAPPELSQEPFKPYNGFVSGAPKPGCHDDRVWTANGINKLRATRDGEIGECPP